MFRSVMLRFVLPLALASCVVAYFGLPYIQRLLAEWFTADVELRAQLVMHTMEAPLTELVEQGNEAKLHGYLAKLTADERLLAVLVCRPDGTVIAKTERLPRAIDCDASAGPAASSARIVQLPSGSVQVSRFDFDSAQPVPFRIVMLYDLSFVDRRQRTARDFILVFIGISVLLLALVAGARGVAAAAPLGQRADRRHPRQALSRRRAIAARLATRSSRRFARCSPRPRRSSAWRSIFARIGPRKRSGRWCSDHLHSSQVIIVSNREPYIHNYNADHRPVVQVPASGMVTALEPIMRACSGVWVAHGAGAADRETVDRFDHISVPPDNPSYTLRRVWLTEEQEQGYYYGFSNEGLWPLCHLAYVRPAFRPSDWRAYEEVNAKFADVVAAEANTDSPVVLIQDFHFALLPKLIRAKIPKATIALFWHIPWPNAETFGVCPWKREMLLHMLSADILGFHTRYHCQNFLDTVDRFVECQIDHEHMTVTLQGRVCRVAAYPISIEWPPRWLQYLPDVAACRAAVRRALPHRRRTWSSASASSAGTSPRAFSSASRRSRPCW